MGEPRVVVVGAGISGAACAAALRAAGVATQVRERARSVGGRLASPSLHGRPVDLGAAYFTVADDDFAAVVAQWQRAGLVREWTDTIEAIGADGREAKSGPMRWAAPGGLRSLVADAHAEVVLHDPVQDASDLRADAVVLAMPDPQAERIAGAAFEWVDYDPVIAVAAGWAGPVTPVRGAAFVNDDADITLVADDGDRRGDGAPVLVMHTTSELARRHLDAPDAAVGPVLSALRRVVGVDAAPAWTHAHRWRFAKPANTHGDAPYGLVERDGGLLGVCGDSWCPSGSPRVESAWLSGHRLGTELARRLVD